jgi:hypothetical protein
VVLAGDRQQRSQCCGRREHALGEIRVQADAFPFRRRERPRLVPDRIRHPEPPKVVDESSPAERFTSPRGRP